MIKHLHAALISTVHLLAVHPPHAPPNKIRHIQVYAGLPMHFPP